MDNSTCAILTVYNQESFIDRVFLGLVNCVSDITKEIIVIIDGCTDRSEDVIRGVECNPSPIIRIIHTPDLNETKANNVGLKLSAEKYRYSIIVQDDCMVVEKGFDIKLLEPFKLFPNNLLGCSGRDAVDTRLNEKGGLDFYNVSGADVKTPSNIFAVRDVVNRGPLMLDNKKLSQLNFLDEDFAPLNQDDTDLSMRGYEQFKYIVGSRTIGFYSPPEWGKTRNSQKSASVYFEAEQKHHKMIVERHYDLIVGEKHSKDFMITE